jgi:hypothetical protein
LVVESCPGLVDHAAGRGDLPMVEAVDMAEVILRDIDPLLLERIRRLAVARGWTREYTCTVLLEQGLFASEHEMSHGFGNVEVDALSEAIHALQALPAGAEFG